VFNSGRGRQNHTVHSDYMGHPSIRKGTLSQPADVMHLLKLLLKANGKRGVGQGSVLAPLLSNLYLNEVNRMLERAKEYTRFGRYTGIEYARFADDLVVLIHAHPNKRWLLKAVDVRLRQELEERSAITLHAAFDVAGAGNVAGFTLAGAPVLDPTVPVKTQGSGYVTNSPAFGKRFSIGASKMWGSAMGISARQLGVIALLLVSIGARADIVADWADTTTRIADDGPNTVRTMALAQNAVYEAVNAITSRYPRDRVELGPTKGASIDAAVAAASRTVLIHEAPALNAKTEAVYKQALDKIPDDEARARGIDVGALAAADLLQKHSEDIGKTEPYRPLTTPGVYVPTTFPLGFAFAQHKPWFMKSASQFRPGPPPALTSDIWARDFNEVKSMGSATSTTRTPEQTEVARFWASSLPDIYIGLVRSVATSPGREVSRNARLYAVVAAMLNEAEIATLEAKYHYQFWRPITAVRNGDRDKNPKTERDPDWAPMTTTPMNPEYPCGNCLIAAAVVAVIHAEAGHDLVPSLKTISNTAPGVTREWTRTEDLVQEVSNARIHAGVHYRNSTEVGNRMGQQIGALVASAYRLP
jgi:Reverse transcriptase (RNA-dependent DNA polymerase)